ncbi:hypothetical protein CDL15_Pgr008306 [Punica granatum]|uniref:Leucine-rich repeat-containing N-terminal plant-type domain-containing protein n=1 Tax=Punica granatum TaxID=22663 RepID=A0A218XI13_PUNGR|nr:hypothetical protein CDL15_Pgr008306 [Punica granatum]
MRRDVWVFLFLSVLLFLISRHSIIIAVVVAVPTSNTSSPYSSQRPSPASECDALLQFSQSFTISRDASADYCDYPTNTSYPKTASWKNGTNCCSWDGVTCHMSKDYVIGLDLSCSRLRGALHSNSTLFSLRNLQRLNLAGNNFIGSPISSRFGILTGLAHLNLSGSSFSGIIPLEMISHHHSNLISLDLSVSLISLDLSDSQDLTIEEDRSFRRASVLDLQANELVGHIPDIFFLGNDLRTIRLSQNRLEGALPRSLANCKNLEVLDLSENKLEDRFPYWLDTLPNLQVLDLRSNKLRGLITGSGKNNHPFPKLHIFDLSDNKFYGHLPAKYIANFIAMKDKARSASQYMWVNNTRATYQDSITVVMKGYTIELVRILSVFTTIDLSRNFFGGDIPELIGDLKLLKGLNLSHNNLTGKIPSSVGNLTNLEWLDLSSNKLNGEIPRGLADLTMLSWLNLSNNHLEGLIPQGRQFDTFNHPFDGNPRLCGYPLPKACGADEQQLPPSTSSGDGEEKAQFGHWIEWWAVAMGYGCGISLGISAGYVMLETRRPKWLARKVERWLVRMVERTRRKKTTRPKKNAAQRNYVRYLFMTDFAH